MQQTAVEACAGLSTAGQKISLLSDSESRNQVFIGRLILLLQIVQQATPSANHTHKALLCVMILAVLLEMLVQILKSMSKEGNLDFRGGCILFVAAKLAEDFLS